MMTANAILCAALLMPVAGDIRGVGTAAVTVGSPAAGAIADSATSLRPVRAASRGVEVIQATGVGRRPPQMKDPHARLMARRAAEVVAVRNLSSEMRHRGRDLRGFRYVSYQTLSDGRIQVTVQATIPQ